MMTPILNGEANEAILRYNTCQMSTRSLIECCNGLLKMIFRCLFKQRVLHYKPDVCSKIINACTVLHNICIHDNIPIPEGEGDLLDFACNDVDPICESEIGAANRNPELSAGRVRNSLIRRYFS